MSAAKKAGVIYILTNPSFPDYVKIGYATNIENRLKQLNRSECIPFAFRVYATYDVSAPLQDKELHSLIDRLNPDLRAIDTFDGKTRTKEFYAMTKEDAYALLESIAKLSGTMDKLQRLTPEGHDGALAELLFDLGQRSCQRILLCARLRLLGGGGDVVVLILCHSVLLLYHMACGVQAVRYRFFPL